MNAFADLYHAVYLRVTIWLSNSTPACAVRPEDRGDNFPRSIATTWLIRIKK
jgi:hypothetical protein